MTAPFTLERDLAPIMHGDAPLPNPEPIADNAAAAILHYREMHCGTAVLDTKKHWHARFFLDYGQGGSLHGSGIAAWVEWKDGAYRVTAVKFAICKHDSVEGPGANHSRGWHPARCSKCGLDLSVDSGD